MTQYDLTTAGTESRPSFSFAGDTAVEPPPAGEIRVQPQPAATQRPRRILMTCAGDRASWSHNLELAA